MGELGEGWQRRQLEAEGAASRTFIDAGAAFDGTLRLGQDLRIDCEFRGEIVCEGTVVIGESAGVEAHIRAREVVIHGAVVGDVTARRLLVVHSTGRLHGDVETPCFELQKHAFFNGRTRMARPEQLALSRAAASATPAPEAPAKVGGPV